MVRYEYMILEVPQDNAKAGLFRKQKAPQQNAVVDLLNQYGGAGWDYVRREIHTHTQRRFLRASTSKSQEVLVMRRALNKTQESMELAANLRVEPAPVQPRRVNNHLAIERVKSGERKLAVTTPRPVALEVADSVKVSAAN